jgi:hypothetical protein
MVLLEVLTSWVLVSSHLHFQLAQECSPTRRRKNIIREVSIMQGPLFMSKCQALTGNPISEFPD